MVVACASTAPAPRMAESESTAETTATIESVDKTSRQVLLRTREKLEKMEQQLAALMAEKTQDMKTQPLPSSDQE